MEKDFSPLSVRSHIASNTMICYNNQIMTSPEQYQSGSDEASFIFKFDMLDFKRFQSNMMDKFRTSDSRFIPKSTPHIVSEDLARAGAVSQPLEGGACISWSNPETLADLRAKNTLATNSESI